MQGAGEPRTELRAHVMSAPVRRRRVFTWRNPLRSARIAREPGCPLLILGPRFYACASLGSPIASLLRFTVQNSSDKPIHSYLWRHASPAPKANGGAGSRPQEELAPGARHPEAAYLAWRGPITITIDFVQFADGTCWLTTNPASAIRQAGLDAGAAAAAAHLLRVVGEGGADALTAALPRIHLDVQDAAWYEHRERFGMLGFYNGVNRAVVIARSAGPDRVETMLRELHARS